MNRYRPVHQRWEHEKVSYRWEDRKESKGIESRCNLDVEPLSHPLESPLACDTTGQRSDAKKLPNDVRSPVSRVIELNLTKCNIQRLVQCFLRREKVYHHFANLPFSICSIERVLQCSYSTPTVHK